MHALRTSTLVLVFAIVSAAAGCGNPVAPAIPTFNRDVAPIVFANCAPCHRPGESAPFALLSYDDAVKHARTIAAVTLKRYMPPWLPEKGEFPITGQRRLTDAEIDLVQRWVDGGMVEGDAGDLPAPPSWPGGWQSGEPDLVLTPERPYVLSADPQEKYRDLVIRTPLTSDVFVRAVEFKTGGAPIHHAVIRVDRTSSSRRRDGQDGQPGFDSAMWHSVQDPDGQFIGWAPGSGPITSPPGMPWRLDRGADLVVEVHLIGAGREVEVRPTIALFFTDEAPVHTPVRVRMASKSLDIPAGVRDYVATDTYTLPVAVDLLSVFPHAHYLGKEMLVTATFPGGDARTLLHIREWNFRWQQEYRFATPVKLPQGATLTMRYTYDNSEENVVNPSRPPVRVRTGERSIDEMATLGLQILPATPEDGARIVQEFAERDLLANLRLAEERVREEPDSADYRALLGGVYVEAGRYADAATHLQEALRLNDRSSGVYGNLGVALSAQGRLAESLPHFERAAALDPRNEVIHFNLGNTLAQLSRMNEAAAAYERALEVNPDYANAYVNLAGILASRGRTDEAISNLQRAARLEPDSPIILLNLANGLASAGRFVEAMPYVKRALELDPTARPAQETFRRLQRMGIQ